MRQNNLSRAIICKHSNTVHGLVFQLLEFERFLTRQSRENPLSVTRKQVVRHIMCSFIHNGQILGPKQGENFQRMILFHFVLRWNHCNHSIWLGNLVFMSKGGFKTNFQGLQIHVVLHHFQQYCSREIKRYASYYHL